MNKTQLYHQLQEVIASKIHIAKSKVADKLPADLWAQLGSNQIAEDAMAEIIELLELWLYIPCCHITGMHDPQHFVERKGICEYQKAEALERFCKDLGINPVVRSAPGCCWCRDYPHYRKGEGVKLFSKATGKG